MKQELDDAGKPAFTNEQAEALPLTTEIPVVKPQMLRIRAWKWESQPASEGVWFSINEGPVRWYVSNGGINDLGAEGDSPKVRTEMPLTFHKLIQAAIDVHTPRYMGVNQ